MQHNFYCDSSFINYIIEAIPDGVLFSDKSFIITLLSALSSFVIAFSSLRKFHDNWIRYRHTAERLKVCIGDYIKEHVSKARENDQDLIDKMNAIIAEESGM